MSGRSAAPAAALMLAVVGCSYGGAERRVAGEQNTIGPRVVVEGAAWTWFNDERAFFHGNRPTTSALSCPGGGGEHRVLLWLRGRYTAYQDYDTDVKALIEAR